MPTQLGNDDNNNYKEMNKYESVRKINEWMCGCINEWKGEREKIIMIMK